jgi:hypothetical protein
MEFLSNRIIWSGRDSIGRLAFPFMDQYSGLGSRKTDLAASLSLRRGAVRGAGGVLEVCVPSSLAVAASGCR